MMVLLLLVVAVLATVFAAQRRRPRPRRGPRRRPTTPASARPSRPASSARSRPTGWSPSCRPSARPAARPSAVPRQPGAVSPATEVLGYLGAVLAMAGVTTLVAQFWDDLTSWSRLALLGAAAVAFLVAGLAVHGEEVDDAAMRLRSFLMLLSTAAAAGFAGLLSADVLDWSPESTVRLVGATVAVQSALLWARRDTRPAQHLTTFGGLVAVVASTVGEFAESGVVGIVLWWPAAGWLAAGWRGLLPPPVVAQALARGDHADGRQRHGRLLGAGHPGRRGGHRRRPPRRRHPRPTGRWWPGSGSSACSCSCRPRSSRSSATPWACRLPSC